MAKMIAQGLHDVSIRPYFTWPHFMPSTESVYLTYIQCPCSERNKIKL